MQEMLKALCQATGVGGQSEISRVAADYLLPLVDRVTADPLGSVIGYKSCGKPGAPVVMLEAHLDEIGFVVTHVDDGGFVHVAPCGGIDRRVLPAAEVLVYADDVYPGVFCSTPPHLKKDGETDVPEIASLGIDVGLTAEEARAAIPAGTRVGFAKHYVPLLGSQVSSPSLDDRAGVCAVLQALRLVKDETLSAEIVVSLSVQEELGCRGAAAAAFTAQADQCIAVDVSFAYVPGDDKASCGAMGAGAMLGFSPVLEEEMTLRLQALAEEETIPYQPEVMGGATGTDADVIATSRSGVRTALLSIPLKYMHTPVEVADTRDIEAVARLLAAYLRKGGAGA